MKYDNYYLYDDSPLDDGSGSGEERNFDDETGFSDYVPHTIDPSPWAFVACVTFCLLLVFLLPFGVALKTKINEEEGLRCRFYHEYNQRNR